MQHAWRMGELVSEEVEIKKKEGKIYVLFKNKINILANGTQNISIDQNHQYIDFAVDGEFIYIVEQTHNKIIQYSTMSSTAVDL